VEAIDGGWRLLNHAKYRAIRDEESALEAKRKYAAKKRAETKVEKVDPSRSKANTVDASRDNAEADAEPEKTPKAPKGAEPVGFADFWSIYPRKESKPNAIKAWVRLSPSDDTQAQILKDVAKRKASEAWVKDNGQYIPHPATYLNQKRWEDLFELPETKETLADKLRAHPGNPNHVAHSTATPDQLAEFAQMRERYRTMT